MRLKSKFKISQLQKEVDSKANLGLNVAETFDSLASSDFIWKSKVESLQQQLEALKYQNMVLPVSAQTFPEHISDENVEWKKTAELLQINLSESDAYNHELSNQIKTLNLEIGRLEDAAIKNNERSEDMKDDLEHTRDSTAETTTAIDSSKIAHTGSRSKRESELLDIIELERQRYVALCDVLQQMQDNPSVSKAKDSTDKEISRLKVQLADRTSEILEIQKNLNSKSDEIDKIVLERDEKFKKFRGLLGAANKSLSASKITIAMNSDELKALSESKEKESELLFELKKSLNESEIIIAGEKTANKLRVNELERKSQILKKELSEITLEFQQYKTRAHLILQQNGSNVGFEKRIIDLEEIIDNLQTDSSGKDVLLEEAHQRFSVLQNDFATLLDRINVADNANEKLRSKEVILNSMKDDLESRIQSLNAELKFLMDSSSSASANSILQIQNLRLKDASNMLDLESYKAQNLDLKVQMETISAVNRCLL